jgi:hypothetical protein
LSTQKTLEKEDLMTLKKEDFGGWAYDDIWT